MRLKLILSTYMLLSCLCFNAKAQNRIDDKGHKQGRWIEYYNDKNEHTDSSLATYYTVRVYKKGKQFGEATRYETNRINLYDRDGLKTGVWIEYYNGYDQPAEAASATYYTRAVYKGGKPYGKIKRYSMPGEDKTGDKLLGEKKYFDGKLNETRLYHENGKLYIETPYIDGKKNGLEKTYYESGILEVETPYAAGKRNGTERRYDKEGKLWRETSYINDKEIIPAVGLEAIHKSPKRTIHHYRRHYRHRYYHHRRHR